MKSDITAKLSFFLFFVLTVAIQPQEKVKIATYNILNYPNQSSTKNTRFQTVIYDLKPDILVVQEILSQSAVNEFKNDVLGDDYQSGDFINGPDTDNAIFYKDSLFQFITTDFINPTQGPRYISVFRLFHKITFDTLIIYSAHFKASQGVENELRRLNEAATLRVFTDLLPPNSDFILVGDLNLYRSTEPAYEELLVQDGTGYFLDPINRPGTWHDSFSFTDIHTQSTRITDLGDGGSTGGLDDRFDFILISQSIMDEGGIDYITDSYWAFGNDGLHLNLSIHDPPNQSVSTDIAIALYLASDHLPVVAEFDFGVASGVEVIAAHEMNFILHQNYPNPFNPSTIINFSLAVNSKVSLKIFDVLGQEVANLVNTNLVAGSHNVDFNASLLNSGVYFYRIEATGIDGTNFTNVKKMILTK